MRFFATTFTRSYVNVCTILNPVYAARSHVRRSSAYELSDHPRKLLLLNSLILLDLHMPYRITQLCESWKKRFLALTVIPFKRVIPT